MDLLVRSSRSKSPKPDLDHLALIWVVYKPLSRSQVEPVRCFSVKLGAGMRRREFIIGLGVMTALPSLARAQQVMPTIGLLSSTSAAPYKPFIDAFFVGLKEKGYVQGKNVAIEYRWADGQYDRLTGFANELVRFPVNVIVAIAPPAAKAAKAATTSIPIVFSTSGDPVALGLVSSMNRPGANLTGVDFMLFTMAAKRLDLLTKVAPHASILGFLGNPNNPSTARSSAEAQSAARSLVKKLIVVGAGTEHQIDTAFAELIQQKVEAISVEADPYLLARREQITTRAAQHSLPVIYPHREYADAGGLISYGTDLFDAYRQIGVYTGRVLNGEHPASLPVMQVTKFEMVINMKAAKRLALVVPPDMLTLADHVIE